MNRGAVAEINLSAIAYNLRSIKKIVKNKPVIAVVKADAYGHSAVEVSKKLIKEGVSYLAVAFSSEAIALRKAGIKSPIIVLFERSDIKDFFDFKLIPVIYDMNTALAISAEAKKRQTMINIHAKIDTGMGRLGLRGKNILSDLIRISEMEGIKLNGLLSHFSEADLLDKSYAVLQLDRFNRIREALSKKLRRKIFSHIANSAAVLAFEDAYLDAVRPGLILYGYSPIIQNTEYRNQKLETDKSSSVKLRPAMKVTTKILCIRNLPSKTPISYSRTFITKRASRIGVLPIGYADGYGRLFSNNADVLVRGIRAPVAGRVCMDLTMVDLTDTNGVKENDEVVIMGKQGKESITAYELAHKANTIPYEVLISLGSKSEKIYVEAD
ncbi:MAG: alanine racemase [Nitrospirota bacterium]